MPTSRPYRVLVLSRNYPNSVLERLGLWVEGLVKQCAQDCEVKVISPVPYFPPFLGSSSYGKYRRVKRFARDGSVDVFHPRFLVGPGHSLHSTEAFMYHAGVRSLVGDIRDSFPFDLIHAHFTYPDGVVAARLGERYNVPVIITEHAMWRSDWVNESGVVGRQVLWAARNCSFHIAVSNAVKNSIVQFTGAPEKIRVIPNGVDGSIFTPLPSQRQHTPDQILYVGFMRHIKGVDILLKAMRMLAKQRPTVRLIIVGGGFYKNYRQEEERLRRMVGELELEANVEFVGIKSPHEVAAYMSQSALLVVPSRSETFGSVLIEALACGIPVVSTRCGGPEDIVNEQVGLIVEKENPSVLAEAMAHILDNRHQYDSQQLRDYALEHFAWQRVAHQNVSLYGEAVECGNRGAVSLNGGGNFPENMGG